MVRIICDKCGCDCDRNAYDVFVQAIHNPAPLYYNDQKAATITDEPNTHVRFTLCQKCYREMQFPNIYSCMEKKKIVWRDEQDE